MRSCCCTNPAWNPQYALYLLPFLILLWPSLRGVSYALALTVLCLAEHPVYVNLIGIGQQPTLLLIIISRVYCAADCDRHGFGI